MEASEPGCVRTPLLQNLIPDSSRLKSQADGTSSLEYLSVPRMAPKRTEVWVEILSIKSTPGSFTPAHVRNRAARQPSRLSDPSRTPRTKRKAIGHGTRNRPDTSVVSLADIRVQKKRGRKPQ